jgi:hypothetical protein
MKFGNEQKQKKIISLALLATFVILLYNSIQISQVGAVLLGGVSETSISTTTSKVNLLAKDNKIIPKGTPKIYGEELQFSYDDIDPYDAAKANAAIFKFSNIDKTLNMEGKDLERYVKILFKDYGGISCEFCCGASSIIFENGKPACGCAHSYAMRGLTKYLIVNHPDMSEEDILNEVGKFKVLFFPTIHEAKAQAMEENGIEFNYIALTTNINRGIEKGAPIGGKMVGGC